MCRADYTLMLALRHKISILFTIFSKISPSILVSALRWNGRGDAVSELGFKIGTIADSCPLATLTLCYKKKSVYRNKLTGTLW